MPYLLAELLGAIAITGLITAGLFAVVKRWNAEIPGMAAACAIAAIIAVTIGTFGESFAWAISLYVPAAIVIFGLMVIGLRRKKTTE